LLIILGEIEKVERGGFFPLHNMLRRMWQKEWRRGGEGLSFFFVSFATSFYFALASSFPSYLTSFIIG